MTPAFAGPDGRVAGHLASPLHGVGDQAAFESALEAAGIGVFDFEVPTGQQRFSARCRALWGLADGEAPTPALIEQRMHPGDRGLLDAVHASLDPHGAGTFDLQHRIVLPDGRIRWIHARGRTVFEGEGAARRAVRSMGTMLDVTRERVEEELLEAIRRLDSPQAVVDQALAILRRTLVVDRCAWSEFEDDGEHSVILGDDADPAMPPLEGRFATRDFGPTFRDAMLGGYACVIDDAQEQIEDPRERAAYAAIGIASAVAWPVQAAGRIVAGMALHHRLPRRWQPDEIDLVRVVAQRCQEAIHRVRAERRRAEAELRLALALDASQIFVWETDVAAGKLHWSENAARVIGCEPGALTDDPQRIDFFVHPDDLPQLRGAFDRCMQERRERFRIEFRGRPDGAAVRDWVTEGRILYDAAGRTLRVVGTTQDITERKAAEAALREADRRKDQFLATLSHELRNPLAPIRNAAHILAMPGLREEQLRGAREVIQRQVGRMALLLDDLLDVSRITRGRLELKKSRVDLRALVDAAVETVRPMLDRQRHAFELALPAQSVVLQADPLRVSQILSNLLHNAAKYTDPGGHIRLSAFVQDERLVVEVADDGIGIAPDALPQLFQMFSQVQGTSGRSEGGLGIGLALVRGLAELHGGRVEAHSDGPGRGSRFRVHLPVGDGGPAAGAPAAQPAAGTAARILVVDDNRDAADTLALLLTASGHEVRVAYDGRSGLEAARAFRPGVALLDIGLPDFGGHELARRIRREPWGGGMRLIALTGWGQDDDRRRSREAGFDQHLTKPVDPGVLAQLLASSLQPGR